MLLTLCVAIGLQHDPATNVYAEDALLLKAAAGDPEPARVQVFWRRSIDPAFTVIDMEAQGDCNYAIDLPVVPGTYEIDYYLVALDASGNTQASMASAEQPLIHTIVAVSGGGESWCDEPCACGGQCGVIDPEGPSFPSAKGPPRYYIDVAAGFSSHGGLLSAELGLHSKRLTVGLELRTVPSDTDETGGLLRVRRFLLGRNGLELGVALGATKTIVAGVSLGYSISLTRRMTALAEGTGLAGIDGETQLNGTLAVQLGF